MEILKKQVKRIMTTGKTGNDIYIMPDLSVDYFFKISLVSNTKDIGFFDTSNSEDTENSISTYNASITGECKSRLSELKKYGDFNDFNLKYYQNGSFLNNGVDYQNSMENDHIVYYIDGIKYIDQYIDNSLKTLFVSYDSGYNTDNYENFFYYKDPNKENIVTMPKTSNDVFIIRQELPVFDKNNNLEFIDSLIRLETYAGGGYYNIINNT